MYYILVGIIVLGAFAAMYAAAWWYQQQVANTVQQLKLVEAKQAMDDIYNCLNAYYDSSARQVVFPGKVVWVKNPQDPNCQAAMDKEGSPGMTKYWHGGRCGYGEGDRVNAGLNDVVALPSACYVKVVRATVYGQTVTIPLATIFG
jgi:type II secretory pathway pseudopilin PulG